MFVWLEVFTYFFMVKPRVSPRCVAVNVACSEGSLLFHKPLHVCFLHFCSLARVVRLHADSSQELLSARTRALLVVCYDKTEMRSCLRVCTMET